MRRERFQRCLRSRPSAALPRLALLLGLAACGGGGGPSTPPTATLSGTLAYVVSECRVDKTSGYLLHQVVQIRRGDRDPITVMGVPDIGPVLSLQAELDCKLTSSSRFGADFAKFGAVQRLAVSTDGETVAFELSDDFSINVRNFLSDALKGIWVVRADGSGLRRLGPPSRQASLVLGLGSFYDLTFSPDGGTLTFPDLGPSPDGTEASQIFLQDVATGARSQITHLPTATPAADLPPALPSALAPFFLDEETVAFATDTDIDGTNPQHESIGATVKRDGSDLKAVRTVALPGGQIVPIFFITGERPQAVTLSRPGEPVNKTGPAGVTIHEIFLLDGDNVLQLTSFDRWDTGWNGVLVGVDRDTVFFVASADPFGENPSEDCQVFSIDRLGANLRQLTHFRETSHSVNGCGSGPVRTGCFVQLGRLGQDVRTQALVFYSSCNPLGTNPNGNQIFVMRPDDSDLRQLTTLRGLVTAPGTFTAELIGPAVFSAPATITLP
jgi:hypothetical protein